MKIFISYSRDDKQFVLELARTLRDKTRREVWYDQELIVSQSWWDEILNQIEGCDYFLLILTPRYTSSLYCPVELEYAQQCGKPLIPLMMKPSELPELLRSIQVRSIENLSLTEIILECSIALGTIDVEIARGKYSTPINKSLRPPVPQPPKPTPQNVFELYTAAEEKAVDDFAAAEKLFQQVISIDPAGLGVTASERLAEIRLERERATAYNNISRLATNPATFRGAQAAWRAYIQRYGAEYDPNGYAVKLTNVPNNPKLPDAVQVPLPSAALSNRPPVQQFQTLVLCQKEMFG